MISIEDELKLFKKKSTDTYEMPINDLYDPLLAVENKMNNIDKIAKKSVMSADFLKQEIEDRDSEISELKRELIDKDNYEEKLARKIIIILDQIDNVYRFAVQSQNEALISNIKSLMKIIKKELREVDFEEIPALGEIFDPELHDCVDTVNDNTKNKYEIVDVIKKGYKLNRNILRTASVIAVK